eukprot:TRINITY_DN29566_c0_g1_i1.p1 TRINITY_DN29566_c0_g1~~TRINITY_DN29566_c0_g1_i1.p1  ORF type:complete len:1975 (+),score=487.58 TRINITY_DN29566_c0_g1_i1:159-6083(+)
MSMESGRGTLRGSQHGSDGSINLAASGRRQTSGGPPPPGLSQTRGGGVPVNAARQSSLSIKAPQRMDSPQPSPTASPQAGSIALATLPVPSPVPISSRPSKRDVREGQDILPTDLVAALLHAMRGCLPLCPPPPDADRATHGYAQARPQGWGVTGYGPGGVPPVSDEQLPTRERLSFQTTFDIAHGLRVQTTAPAIFVRILHWCRVSPEEFIADWALALEGQVGQLGQEQSKGKSASSFIVSAQRRWMIKTLNEEEAASLRRLLPSYYVHLLHNPNTLLNPHVGLWTVVTQGSDASQGKRKSFTVLPNVLPTNPGLPVSMTFDLKGSTHKRAASEQEKQSDSPVLKDNDFLELGTRFAVGSLDYALLCAQLNRDCHWLEVNNLMDYSFLVGRCQCTGGAAALSRLSYQSHPTAVSKGAGEDDDDLIATPPPWPQPFGLRVLRSVSTATLYFVGIIDMLQDYNFRKRAAHTMKTTFGGADDQALSTVPPEQYAHRFSQFIVGQCFTRQKDVQWSFFMDPRQTAGERSKLHKDDAIAVGDVVGRTHKDVLTLDLFDPGIKSLCVIGEVRPARHASEQMDDMLTSRPLPSGKVDGRQSPLVQQQRERRQSPDAGRNSPEQGSRRTSPTQGSGRTSPAAAAAALAVRSALGTAAAPTGAQTAPSGRASPAGLAATTGRASPVGQSFAGLQRTISSGSPGRASPAGLQRATSLYTAVGAPTSNYTSGAVSPNLAARGPPPGCASPVHGDRRVVPRLPIEDPGHGVEGSPFRQQRLVLPTFTGGRAAERTEECDAAGDSGSVVESLTSPVQVPQHPRSPTAVGPHVSRVRRHTIMGRPTPSAKVPLLALPQSSRPAGPQMYSYTCSSGWCRVNVAGPVAVGDFLVPSGRNDGTAHAVPISCRIPPYAFGVVDLIPDIPAGHLPDPSLTKYTVVEATVEERYVFDPPLRWQSLEVVGLSWDPMLGISQGVWADLPDALMQPLTRAVILSACDLSAVKLERPMGGGPAEWALVDWVQGIFCRQGASTPLRCADGPEVVAACLQDALRLRRLRAAALLDRVEGRRGPAALTQRRGTHHDAASVAPLLTSTTSGALGDRSGAQLRRQRAGTDIGASAQAAAAAGRKVLVAGDDTGGQGTADFPLNSARTAESSVLSSADRSFGGWMRDWFSSGWTGLRRLNKSMHAPVQQQRVKQAFLHNMGCWVAKLFSVKGLVRQVLVFLTVPDMARCARVSLRWQEQWRAAELWGAVLPHYRCYEAGGGQPGPSILRELCPEERREVHFSVGERWTELFGLGEPPFLTLRRRMLELSSELGQYDMLFDCVLPPFRVLSDLALYRREQHLSDRHREGAAPGDTTHTWEMDRAFQVLNPHLIQQWLRSNNTLRIELVPWSWQLTNVSSGKEKGDRVRSTDIFAEPHLRADVLGEQHTGATVLAYAWPEGWLRLQDGSGFVQRETPLVSWRRGAHAPAEVVSSGAIPQEQLVDLRRDALHFLDGQGSFVKMSWDGPTLLVRYQQKAHVDAVIAAYEREGGLARLGFLLGRYSATESGRGMQMRRRIMTWRDAKDRMTACAPGVAGNSALRRRNPTATPQPPEVAQTHMDLALEAQQVHAELLDCLERYLFPPGRGSAVVLRAGRTTGQQRQKDKAETEAVVGVASPRTTGQGAEVLVEVYDLRDSHQNRLPGQVFPVFFVTAAAACTVTETNDAYPRLSRPAAVAHPHGHVCFEGHSGLQVYVICAMSAVLCGPEKLRRLLLSVDMAVSAEGSATLYYTVHVPGQRLPGGGVYSNPPLWVCPRLERLEAQILAVFSGELDHIDALDHVAQRGIEQAVCTELPVPRTPVGAAPGSGATGSVSPSATARSSDAGSRSSRRDLAAKSTQRQPLPPPPPLEPIGDSGRPRGGMAGSVPLLTPASGLDPSSSPGEPSPRRPPGTTRASDPMQGPPSFGTPRSRPLTAAAESAQGALAEEARRGGSLRSIHSATTSSTCR